MILPEAKQKERNLNMPEENINKKWEPKIIAFFCNWCTYTAADLAGVSRLKYAPNVKVIRLMCSGRVDPQFILQSLASGADGVLIGGCHPGDCHYSEGNYKMLRRFRLLQRVLRSMGVEDERVRLEWISASEGEKVKTVINEMVDTIRKLGPLGLPGKISVYDKDLAELKNEIDTEIEVDIKPSGKEMVEHA